MLPAELEATKKAINNYLSIEVHKFFENISELSVIKESVHIATDTERDQMASLMRLELSNKWAAPDAEWSITSRCCQQHTPKLIEVLSDGTFQHKNIKWISSDMLGTIKMCRWDSMRRALDEAIEAMKQIGCWNVPWHQSYVPEMKTAEQKLAWDMHMTIGDEQRSSEDFTFKWLSPEGQVYRIEPCVSAVKLKLTCETKILDENISMQECLSKILTHSSI